MDDIAIAIALAEELTELYKEHDDEEMRTQMQELTENVIETLQRANSSAQSVRAKVLAEPALRTVRDALQELVDETHATQRREKSWCVRVLCCLCVCRCCCRCCARCCCRCCRRCCGRWCCCCCYDPDAVHAVLLMLAEGNQALGLAIDDAVTAYENELLEKLQSLETMIEELDDSSPEGDKKLLDAMESLQLHVDSLPGADTSSAESGGNTATVAPDTSSSNADTAAAAAQAKTTADSLVRRAQEARSSGGQASGSSGSGSGLRSETLALAQSLKQGSQGRSAAHRQGSAYQRSRQQQLLDNQMESSAAHTQSYDTILRDRIRRLRAEHARLRRELEAVRRKYARCPVCGVAHDAAEVSVKGPPPRIERVIQEDEVIHMSPGEFAILPSSINRLFVGCYWEPAEGDSIDLDIGAVMITGCTPPTVREMVFYGNKNAPGVDYPVDNTKGWTQSSVTDSEHLDINFENVPSEVANLVVMLSVTTSGKTLADTKNAWIRVVAKGAAERELARYSFSTDILGLKSMFCVTLARGTRGWGLKILGQGCTVEALNSDEMKEAAVTAVL